MRFIYFKTLTQGFWNRSEYGSVISHYTNTFVLKVVQGYKYIIIYFFTNYKAILPLSFPLNILYLLHKVCQFRMRGDSHCAGTPNVILEPLEQSRR